jgi:hypothetical protein
VSSQERGTINQQKPSAGEMEKHFEEHLNENSESEQPISSVDLRDNGVEIDLPNREEIERAVKYLKNNKTAGADSIAAELLKNCGPSETLPKSWTEGVLCPVYKKGDKLEGLAS